MPQEAQQELGSVAILHTRGGHNDGHEQPQRIHQDMALAAFALLSPVKTFGPPRPGVLTVCESIMVALGCRVRPSRTRRSPRNVSLIRFQVPSLRQRQK